MKFLHQDILGFPDLKKVFETLCLEQLYGWFSVRKWWETRAEDLMENGKHITVFFFSVVEFLWGWRGGGC